MAGITRVHGGLINPKSFAGVGLQDFTLSFWVGDAAAVAADVAPGPASDSNGALDLVFRTSVGTVASLSRVGTLANDNLSVRFATEGLGFEGDNNGDGFLGTGPDDALTGSGNYGTTADALTAAIQALGTVNGVHLTSATVAKFVY